MVLRGTELMAWPRTRHVARFCGGALSQRLRGGCEHQRKFTLSGAADDHDAAYESGGDGGADGNLPGGSIRQGADEVTSGTAPLSYQWQKNGANIAGATSSSYTTPATTIADSGATFDVVVSNSIGNATSNLATLTASAAPLAPTITTQPVNQTVTAGQ